MECIVCGIRDDWCRDSLKEFEALLQEVYKSKCGKMDCIINCTFKVSYNHCEMDDNYNSVKMILSGIPLE